MDNMQLIVLGLTFLGVLAAIVVIPWYLSRKLSGVDHRLDLMWSRIENRLDLMRSRIENRLDLIENRLDLMAKTINGLLGLIGNMIQIIHKRVPLSDDELGELMAVYAEMSSIPTQASPLALEERERINSYLNKVHRGQLFTPEEVEDYIRLVKKLEQEKKDDPNVWPLVALGAFLSGLFLPPKKKTIS